MGKWFWDFSFWIQGFHTVQWREGRGAISIIEDKYLSASLTSSMALFLSLSSSLSSSWYLIPWIAMFTSLSRDGWEGGGPISMIEDQYSLMSPEKMLFPFFWLWSLHVFHWRQLCDGVSHRHNVHVRVFYLVLGCPLVSLREDFPEKSPNCGQGEGGV